MDLYVNVKGFADMPKIEREGYINRYIKFAFAADAYCQANLAKERGLATGEWIDSEKRAEEAHDNMVRAWNECYGATER